VDKIAPGQNLAVIITRARAAVGPQNYQLISVLTPGA
jgi:hypothetical protein